MKFSNTIIVTGFLALTLSSALRAQDVDLSTVMPKDQVHRYPVDQHPGSQCTNCHDQRIGQLSEAKLRASGATDEQIEAMKKIIKLNP